MKLRPLCFILPILFWIGCSKEHSRTAPADPVVAINPSPIHEQDRSSDFQATLPGERRTGGYTGSGACRKCHEDQFASWHRTFHRTMTQVVSGESVQADFNNVILTTDTTRFTLNKRDDEFWVRMEPLVQSPIEAGEAPALEQRVSLVTGSHHMQVFWVPEGSGNLQLGFPFTWLIEDKKWVPRNSTFVRPPDLAHHAEVWNVACSRCHTTGIEPRINFAARTAETRVADLGISCEACHGPGERHIQAQGSGKKELLPGEITHPKKLTAERSAQVCGFCHSMKWIDKSSNWRQAGFEFRPGDDLEKTTPVIRPSRVDAIAGLKEYLARNPDVLNDFFWPDGMIRVSGREYNGLIESPCYKGGKFSCLSCHSMHDSEPDDQLIPKAQANGACLQCHEQFRESVSLAAHTHHPESSSGSSCYNCHMPHSTYGILKSIRSHQISSPYVAEDRASGRPNACNLCHLDKTLAWTSEKLAAWYGQPAVSDAEANVSHLVQLALAGDAGQRVLAAWHFGWAPAVAVSGATNWSPAILASLLDDDYAAVRYVAARSVGQLGIDLPVAFDFTIDPAKRPAAALPKVSAPNSAQLLITDGGLDRQRAAELLSTRSKRKVRLRE